MQCCKTPRHLYGSYYENEFLFFRLTDRLVSQQARLALAARIALLTVLCKLRSRFIYSNLNVTVVRHTLALVIAGLNYQSY